jgi:hypothetical protein
VRRVLLAAAVLVAAPFAAHAQQRQRALHDIPWYVAHPAARGATLRLCHNDNSYAGMPDCANAENAAAGQVGSGSSIGRLKAMLNDPNYWRQNPVARDGAMVQCRRRGPGDAMVLPYCAAIQAGGGQ